MCHPLPFARSPSVLHTPQAAETKAAVPEVSGRVFVQAAAHAEVGQRPRIPGPNQRGGSGDGGCNGIHFHGGVEWRFWRLWMRIPTIRVGVIGLVYQNISNILELWSNWCCCINLIEILRSVLLHHPRKSLNKAKTGTVARRGNIDLEPGAGHWTKTNNWWPEEIRMKVMTFRSMMIIDSCNFPLPTDFSPRHLGYKYLFDFETTCMTRKYSRGAEKICHKTTSPSEAPQSCRGMAW